MKIKFLFLVAAFLMAMPTAMQADSKKELKKELNEKASKDARNEAKRLKKEGYVPAPGALPLEKQLDRHYHRLADQDDDLNPKYFSGQGSAVGQNYDAARVQAVASARQDLASKIESDITSITTQSLANEDLGGEEAASIAKAISENKTFVSQHLGQLIPSMEYYRTLKNGNKEVVVVLMYSRENALKMVAKEAKEMQRKKLEEELNK